VKRITNARVVTEEGVIAEACIEVEEGGIVSVGAGPVEGKAGDVDLGGAWVVPGFLDVHVHPEGPRSLGDLREYVRELSRRLLSIGTTGILWTLGDEPLQRLLETAMALGEVLADPPTPCAVMGIHFEGPYISPTALGAFDPETISTPLEAPVERLFEAGGGALAYVSLSPDVPGAAEVIKACVERGVRVGLGHSLAAPEVVEEAIAAGASAVIHTFNNTPRYPMKEGGVRGVTLDEVSMTRDDVMNEVICDGIHVDPVLVRALARAKGREGLMIVTDSVAGGVAMKDGEKVRGGENPIFLRDGVGRNRKGMMAGSALTMERAFRNFVRFTGASMEDAVRATSLNTARFLGMDDERGRIAPGYRADFAVLDDDLFPCMDRLRAV